MRNHGADEDTVIIESDSRVINDVSTPTWELYMTAQVETWDTTSVQSDVAGAGDLDTAWTGTFDADHL